MGEPTRGLYRDQGIVLRGIRLGEADRILSIYTQGHGKVRAVAKGVRRAKSRFGGRLEPFTHVEVVLYRGRGELDTVTEADIVTRFPRLRTDYAAFCAAGAMADALERATPDHERNVRYFVLLRGGLGALSEGAEDPALCAYAFLAKLASMAGLHPTLGVCVECGGPERVGFSFGGGGAVCSACAGRSDPKASEEAIEAWTGFIEHGWDELRSETLEAGVKREVAGLLLGFCQWQMESRFRAFGLLAGVPATQG